MTNLKNSWLVVALSMLGSKPGFWLTVGALLTLCWLWTLGRVEIAPWYVLEAGFIVTAFIGTGTLLQCVRLQRWNAAWGIMLSLSVLLWLGLEVWGERQPPLLGWHIPFLFSLIWIATWLAKPRP